MKGDSPENLNLTPQQERAILDEIRNDHDIIARLNITPQELEALSKCALLGTLTCKQDMLFILRQIREATSLTIDHTTLFPSPPVLANAQEYSGPDLSHLKARVAPIIIPVPGSVDSVVGRRLPKQFRVLLWVVVVAGLVSNGVLILLRS